jgi:hypothetical protein
VELLNRLDEQNDVLALSFPKRGSTRIPLVSKL